MSFRMVKQVQSQVNNEKGGKQKSWHASIEHPQSSTEQKVLCAFVGYLIIINSTNLTQIWLQFFRLLLLLINSIVSDLVDSP